MQNLHDLCVGQGWVSPLDFWNMTPGQVWWTIRAKMPKKVQASRSANASLYRLLKESKAKDGKGSR